MKAAQEALVGRIEGLEAQALDAAQRLQTLAQERSAAAARVRDERAAEEAGTSGRSRSRGGSLGGSRSSAGPPTVG